MYASGHDTRREVSGFHSTIEPPDIQAFVTVFNTVSYY